MRKKSLFLLALFMVMPGLIQAEEMVLIVKTSVANIRLQPDNGSQVILKVKQGTELVASGQKGAWFELSVNDAQGKPVKGYIHESTVEIKSTEKPPTRPSRALASRKSAQPRSEGKAGLPAFLKGFRVSLMPALTSMTFSEVLDPGESKKSRLALGGGIGYERKVYRLLHLGLGLQLSPGGCIVDSETFKVTMSGYALTLPVLLKARFLSGYSPTAFIGGQVGIILQHKFRTLNKATQESIDEDMSDMVNRFYYGLVAGAGFEYPLRSLMLVAEVQYHLGLSNLIKNPEPGESTKTSSIVLSLGVKVQ